MAEAGKPFAVVYDYGQLYLYDAAREWPGDENPYIDALDAATGDGLTVGVHDGLVDLLMPRQENFAATIEVVLGASPPPVATDADHIVEFDVQLDSGRLVLEGSGGSGIEQVAVPAGSYRARLTGRNFDAASAWSYGDADNPHDSYLLDLWPTSTARPPVELRRWVGYADRL